MLRGLEIVHAALGVDQVEGLSQIDFLQQMMGEAAGVSRFQDEVVGEFAGEGEVDHLRVGSLQVVVDAPGDGQAVGIWIV